MDDSGPDYPTREEGLGAKRKISFEEGGQTSRAALIRGKLARDFTFIRKTLLRNNGPVRSGRDGSAQPHPPCVGGHCAAAQLLLACVGAPCHRVPGLPSIQGAEDAICGTGKECAASGVMAYRDGSGSSQRFLGSTVGLPMAHQRSPFDNSVWTYWVSLSDGNDTPAGTMEALSITPEGGGSALTAGSHVRTGTP